MPEMFLMDNAGCGILWSSSAEGVVSSSGENVSSSGESGASVDDDESRSWDERVLLRRVGLARWINAEILWRALRVYCL